jgi:hypothetical protein
MPETELTKSEKRLLVPLLVLVFLANLLALLGLLVYPAILDIGKLWLGW